MLELFIQVKEGEIFTLKAPFGLNLEVKDVEEFLVEKICTKLKFWSKSIELWYGRLYL